MMRLRQDGHDEIQIHGPEGECLTCNSQALPFQPSLQFLTPFNFTFWRFLGYSTNICYSNGVDKAQLTTSLPALQCLQCCKAAYAGLAANLHGLRHFVQWKHPRVFASEHSQWDSPQVYEVGPPAALLLLITCSCHCLLLCCHMHHDTCCVQTVHMSCWLHIFCPQCESHTRQMPTFVAYLMLLLALWSAYQETYVRDQSVSLQGRKRL